MIEALQATSRIPAYDRGNEGPEGSKTMATKRAGGQKHGTQRVPEVAARS